MHGYDVNDPEMSAIFIASGPHFVNTPNPPAHFSNVEVYGLLADVLKIKPLPNNGTGLLVGNKSKPMLKLIKQNRYKN